MTVAQVEVYVANWSDAPNRIQKQPKCLFWTRSSKASGKCQILGQISLFLAAENGVSVRAPVFIEDKINVFCRKVEKAGQIVHNQMSVVGNMECGSIQLEVGHNFLRNSEEHKVSLVYFFFPFKTKKSIYFMWFHCDYSFVIKFINQKFESINFECL